MKITLFGSPGTGTSTVGKMLCEKLGYEYGYTGAIFRNKAKELGLTIYEFDELQKDTFEYDKQIDQDVAQYGKDHDNFVFEGRLAWHFISDSFKIKFVCDEHEAMRRVAEREGISNEEAREKSTVREKSLEQRYKGCYPDLPYPPADSEFDFIIDTTSITPEQVVEKIIANLPSDK